MFSVRVLVKNTQGNAIILLTCVVKTVFALKAIGNTGEFSEHAI